MRRWLAVVRAWPPTVWDLLAGVSGIACIGAGAALLWGPGAALLMIGGLLVLGALWPQRPG